MNGMGIKILHDLSIDLEIVCVMLLLTLRHNIQDNHPADITFLNGYLVVHSPIMLVRSPLQKLHIFVPLSVHQ